MNGLPACIRLDAVDWSDVSFEIRTFVPPTGLKESLHQYGMLFLPWLLEGANGRYVIVDGFKRIQWALENGQSEVQGLVLDARAPKEELLLRRIEARMFGPPVNVAEKARIIALLTASAPDSLMANRYCPMLGIPSKREGIDKWCLLASSGDALLEAAALGEVCERGALELAVWEDEARDAALLVLRVLRCSASIQMEVLERITEIAVRREEGRTDTLGHEDVQRIVQREDWSHRQKTQALRDLLGAWRYPRLRARQERFASEMAAASVPKGLHLEPPPSFEGNRWQLSLSFSSPGELRKLSERAGALADSEQLEKLMAPDPLARPRS